MYVEITGLGFIKMPTLDAKPAALLTIRVDVDLLEAFRSTTTAEGASQSRILRDAIIDFLKENRAEATDGVKTYRRSKGRLSRPLDESVGEAVAA